MKRRYKDSVFCQRLNKLIISAAQVQELYMTDICREMGISYTTFHSYTYGVSIPRPEMLVVIADYFGVSVDYLLGREGYEMEDNK